MQETVSHVRVEQSRKPPLAEVSEVRSAKAQKLGNWKNRNQARLVVRKLGLCRGEAQ